MVSTAPLYSVGNHVQGICPYHCLPRVCSGIEPAWPSPGHSLSEGDVGTALQEGFGAEPVPSTASHHAAPACMLLCQMGLLSGA